MSNEPLTVSRGRITPRNGRPVGPMTPGRVGQESISPHPLSILALASSLRLENPKLEHERVVMLEVAIVAGRDAARAMDRWLSQAMTEYRGSRSAWDLSATTVELRTKLNRFERIARDSADRLVVLAPELLDRVPEYVPVPGRTKEMRLLEEVAAATYRLESINLHSTDRLEQRTSGM